MSIKSEIDRIQRNVALSLIAVQNKGVALPTGATSDDLPTLINSISTQSGSATVSGSQPKNLLNNSDFTNPVNQRGQETYTGSGEYTYTIDRWIAGDGDTVSIALPDNPQSYSDLQKYITGDGAIYQYFEADWRDVADGIITFAACDTDGTIHCVTTSGEGTGDGLMSTTGAIGVLDGFIPNEDDVTKATGLVFMMLGSWRWAAVYPGSYTVDTLPPYVSKGYATEYLECSRYYRNYVGRFTPVTFTATDNARMTVHTPVPMRTTPTATLVNADNIIVNTGGSWKVLSVTSAAVDSMENCNIYLNLGCNASDSELYATGSTFVTNIELDAELYL